MSDIDEQFQAAVAASTELPAKPNQDTMLKLYSLYKQATEGDVEGKRPGFTNPVGRAKYDARGNSSVPPRIRRSRSTWRSSNR